MIGLQTESISKTRLKDEKIMKKIAILLGVITLGFLISRKPATKLVDGNVEQTLAINSTNVLVANDVVADVIETNVTTNVVATNSETKKVLRFTNLQINPIMK